MKFKRTFAAILAALALIPAGTAGAQDAGWDGQVSLRGVAAKRDVAQGDEFDSSGLGARAEIGHETRAGKTSLRIEVDASVFDYSDTARSTRESYGARLGLRQQVSKSVQVGVEVRHVANQITVEADSSDQSSLRGEVTWEQGKDRLRFYADYIDRSYDGAVPATGTGTRFGAAYRRHLGSYHWIEIGGALEDIESSNPRRGYARQSLTADYSLPVSKRARLRFSLDHRRWKYDRRTVLDAPAGKRRHEAVVAPGFGIALGGSKGLYGQAKASYEFRKSNDPRYRKDAPRGEVVAGYRF